MLFRSVSSSEEVLSAVHHGMGQRAMGSTLIHQHSSRSHLIVTLHISQPPTSGSVSTSTSFNSLDQTITPVQSAESTPLVSMATKTTVSVFSLLTCSCRCHQMARLLIRIEALEIYQEASTEVGLHLMGLGHTVLNCSL